MIAKLPIISSPLAPHDIRRALKRAFDRTVQDEFSAELRRSTGLRHIYTAGSGIACFYLILKALKERYGKTEVILPAYTAGSLVVAVRKAKLTPVLVDISLADFNADINAMSGVISKDTLALTCVHMFGIGMDSVDRLRGLLPPGTVLIEDCCQSMGSTIRGQATGSYGDISFFSFNRGKNVPLSGGGCIATNAEVLAGALAGQTAEDRRPPGSGIGDALRSAACVAASDPRVYGALFPLAARFKETAPPDDISIGRMTNVQAALGLFLMRRKEELFRRRHENGAALIRGLQEVKGVFIPVTPPENRAVYNRLPVVFEDAAMRTEAERVLWRRGVETSRMYIRPLHHMFDLGYPESAFPHACYVAQRLLTLPTHPNMTNGHIDTIVGAVRDVLRRP